MSNKRITELRASGMSKSEAKHDVYGRVSRRVPVAAPMAWYRRLSRMKRDAARA